MCATHNEKILTLFYEHQIELYESMIDFLQNDCGMKTELQASN